MLINKINIDEITRSFAPKISHEYVRKYFRLEPDTKINNDSLFAKMEKLTNSAYPTSLPTEEINDTRWEYFYLPMKHEDRLICTPIFVMLYRSFYHIGFPGINNSIGLLEVDKGKGKCPVDPVDYELLIDEAIRFVPLMKETGNDIVEQAYPYNYRRGKIRRKYFTGKEKLMPAKMRKEIEAAYQGHLEKRRDLGEVSLNDYLNTAAICYQGAFNEKAAGITPREMYKRWADNRDFGMLEVNPDSKKEYTEWLMSNGRRGSHQFEILYSPIKSGIHLYPPEKEHPFYRLSAIIDIHVEHFIRMVTNLVKHNVPFETYCLKDALDYLTGESLVDVNGRGYESFHYLPSREYREKYFPHIQWNEIKVLKYK